MTRAPRDDRRRPETLLVMSEGVLRTQWDGALLERLGVLAGLADPMWTSSFDDPAARSRLAQVEVLVTSWGCPRLDSDVLDRMPRLGAVLHAAGTVRHHVGDEVFARGIRVTSAAAANAIPVAEFTLAAVIWANKRVPFLAADARLHRDDWSYVGRYGELSNRGRVVGVLGFSRVGRLVVERLRTLDVEVLVADPYVDPAAVAQLGARHVDLEDMLPLVDVLSIHAPDLDSTRGIIGRRELAALKDGATLINTARGRLVDTAALEAECVTGRLFAILDVTWPEPLPASSRLYSLDNVMITPHVAGSLGSETLRMSAAVLDEIERYAGGLPAAAPVTSETLGLLA